MSDLKWMRRALDLAQGERRFAHPNPRVGCVIVRGGRVVGQGRHARFGEAHAEANALRRAGARARGATLYVSLEPCRHWGKTPPCVEAIVRSGVRRVVAAGPDPSALSRGRAFADLRRRGIVVAAGLLRAEAERLNRGFFSRERRGRPWVVWKAAQTLDGRIASRTGVSRWITGPEARRRGHRLRAESDAVLAGAGTVRRDDPLLTAHGEGPDPLRLVLSRSLSLSPRSRVFGPQAPTWVLTGDRAGTPRARRLERAGAQVLGFSDGRGGVDLEAALRALARMGVSQLMLEGGGRTAHAFLAAGLVDEAWVFLSPTFLGGMPGRAAVEGPGWAAPGLGPRLRPVDVRRVGEDWLVRGMVVPAAGPGSPRRDPGRG